MTWIHDFLFKKQKRELKEFIKEARALKNLSKEDEILIGGHIKGMQKFIDGYQTGLADILLPYLELQVYRLEKNRKLYDI